MRVLAITLAIVFAGCHSTVLGIIRDGCPTTPQTALTSKTKATNVKQLINQLKRQGKEVVRKGKVVQPFFSIKGSIIAVGDQELQVFEYPTSKAAESDARKINLSGSEVGTSMPLWVAPPHFFKNGRLIVLYVGEDSSLIGALEEALGPQVAGK